MAGNYDKNYPTIDEMEDNLIRAGSQSQIIQCDFGKVACAICFDLNFDELRSKYALQKPDLVLFCSVYHGGLMQPYWAYSCRAHLVSSIGNLRRLPSHIISPLGCILSSTTNYHDFVTATINLDCCVVHLDGHWQKLSAKKQKYGPEVSVFDPGMLGSVLISSQSKKRTVDQLIREFDMELLDDYLDRSRLCHQDHMV